MTIPFCESRSTKREAVLLTPPSPPPRCRSPPAGFALMPIGTQLIIDAEGWRTAALALAGLVAVCGILPAAWWLHPRPERYDLAPDGVASSTTGSRSARVALPEVDWTRGEALRTRAFWLVTAAVGLQSWAGGAINLHQIPHLVDRGLSPPAAALGRSEGA